MEEGCHDRFCCGIGVCSCMNIQNCLSKCSFDKVGAIDIEEEDDRKWMELLGQVDWPKSNFEHFIKMFKKKEMVHGESEQMMN